MAEKGVIAKEVNEAKEKVVSAGIKLIESGLIARTWGNVSCRIDESHFAITPSGRDYLTLTLDDIVIVRNEDLSYTGDVKPSGEKAVHAEIYKARADIHFVIHTHQENASVISTLGLDHIDIGLDYKMLGNKIICAAYGLPGTKKLRKSVGEALTRSSGNAIIMKNHGAVCFGVDDDAAFRVAMELEQASIKFIEKRFLTVKPGALSEIEAMRRFIGAYVKPQPEAPLDKSMSDIMHEIYLKIPKIKYICHSEMPYTLAFSEIGGSLLPFVDDFAQIIGTKVKTVPAQPHDITSALSHSAAVFIQGHGALCTGVNKGDAHAVQMILEKNAKAKICGLIFGGNEPLNWIDTHLMRIVYLKKYAKQIEGGHQ